MAMTNEYCLRPAGCFAQWAVFHYVERRRSLTPLDYKVIRALTQRRITRRIWT